MNEIKRSVVHCNKALTKCILTCTFYRSEACLTE